MKILRLSPADDVQKCLDNLNEPAIVYLSKGLYRQKIQINADDVTLCGEDRESTVISYDDYARKIHSDGREYNTFRTYTLCVTGNRVKLENVTVENSNREPEKVGQCVALSVHGKLFKAQNVDLKSTQDTVFLSPFPDDLVVRYRGFIPHNQLYTQGSNLHLFENCRIYGTVDFIFGCAEAYFKNCEIISLNDARGTGFVAAPAHSLAQEHGFCFINCDFVSNGAPDASVYFSRPWRDFGKSVFINCKADRHIKPELFDRWNDTQRDKTARFEYFGLDCAFDPAPVEWAKELSAEQAQKIIDICSRKINEFPQ